MTHVQLVPESPVPIEPVSRPKGEESLRDEVGRITNRLTELVERLTRSERRFQALLDNANDAIAVLDRRGIILEVNGTLTRLVGRSAEQMRGTPISRYSSALIDTDSAADFRRMLAAGGATAEMVSLRTAEGQVRVLSFSAAIVDVEGDQLVLALGRDVTESESARRALANSEARLQSVLNHMPVGVWTMNADLTFTYLSPGIERITGFTAEELLRQATIDPDFWTSRIDPDDLARIGEERTRFLARKSAALDCEYRWRTGRGNSIWLRDRARWRTEQDGSTVCDGIFDDVTERHALEDSLCQAQKMEAVGQLAGGVAHDFNNLLTVIMANAHFLIEDLAGNESGCAEAGDILQAAQRGSALTRQLLLFSRKHAIQPERVGVEAAVRQLCKMLVRLIGEDIALHVTADPAAGDVLIDPAQLEQVVLNLAVNSRDAMPEGGRLDIEICPIKVTGDGMRVNTGVLAPGEYVSLVVKDSGCGIAPQHQERVFEPFFTTKVPGHGTGLGLSTVHGIATHAGGGVALESRVGEGTRFCVYLPRLAPAERLAPTAVPLSGASATGTERILIVEDENMVSAVATRILLAAGYRVLAAPSAEAAEQILGQAREPVDLLLSDVVMPGANGPQLVARAKELRPSLKVLFMSGHSRHAALEKQQVMGESPLLRKPFTSIELLRAVRAALGAKRANESQANPLPAAPPRPHG